jgi:hypothetical protein
VFSKRFKIIVFNLLFIIYSQMSIAFYLDNHHILRPKYRKKSDFQGQYLWRNISIHGITYIYMYMYKDTCTYMYMYIYACIYLHMCK